jgi:hypothetical protein
MGCGTADPGWVYGGTSQNNYSSGGYGEYNGGHVFVCRPGVSVRNLWRPVKSQRNIHSITSFAKPGPVGWICAGTGPDSTYLGLRCGGDCEQAAWDSITVDSTSGDKPWVSGLCRVGSGLGYDTVFGTVCDVDDADSASVFRFMWNENPSWHFIGRLRGGEYRAGPMVARSDRTTYFCSVLDSSSVEVPRFYRWTSRGWNPGKSGLGFNPEFWVCQNSDFDRFRSLAVAGADEVYIGTGGTIAHVLEFTPNAALGGQCSKHEPAQIRIEQTNLLLTAYPNPCRGEVQVAYSVPGGNCPRIVLGIHDTAGRAVRTLMDGPNTTSSGIRLWDGADESGKPVPAGVYLCTLTAGGLSRTEKVTLLK